MATPAQIRDYIQKADRLRSTILSALIEPPHSAADCLHATTAQTTPEEWRQTADAIATAILTDSTFTITYHPDPKTD
jgi:hypothetical protein